jgi:tetratricopeptide (TPR) repeat protein
MRRSFGGYLKSIKLFIVLFLLFAARLMAAGDIDIDTTASNASSAATPIVSTDEPTAGAPAGGTPTGVSTASVSLTPSAATQAVSSTPSENSAEEPVQISSPTPVSGQGILKMKDVYKAGLVYYKQQDFANAIRYLKESLQIQDPYTPQYYYAEANAILGMIYQFHMIDKSVAYHYYKEALSIDPTTATAKKHIKEVQDYKDSE